MKYDQNNDAHKLSNYKEWKETAHIVTDVEIDIESTGITKEDLALLLDCVVNDTPFLLFSEVGVIIVLPEFNAVKKGETLIRYQHSKQFSNALKLLLFNYNRVYVPEKNKIITDDNIWNKKSNRRRLDW